MFRSLFKRLFLLVGSCVLLLFLLQFLTACAQSVSVPNVSAQSASVQNASAQTPTVTLRVKKVWAADAKGNEMEATDAGAFFPGDPILYTVLVESTSSSAIDATFH